VWWKANNSEGHQKVQPKIQKRSCLEKSSATLWKYTPTKF